MVKLGEHSLGVNKFYAIYEQKDDTNKIVDVYQAIKLIDEDKKIVTTPKDKCPLFDIETYLKVYPVRAKNPYFQYYSGKDSPISGRNSVLEYTPELKIYIRAFEEIMRFRIEEKDCPPIAIYPKKMHKLKRIETSDSFVVLKFLVELKETKPYSFFYKYNGYLGLEFTVTSKPKPIKCKELQKQGIALFHAELTFPRWTNVPKEINDESVFEALSEEIKHVYQNTKYMLQGKFINDAVNFPDYKEKYIILNDFERQCDELTEEKKKLKKEIDVQEEKLKSLKVQKEKQQQQIDATYKRLEEYRSEIVHYENLKDENSYLNKKTNELNQLVTEKNSELKNCRNEVEKLTIDNTVLKKEEKKLHDSLSKVTSDLSEANEQIEKIENQGFFKNLFSRKK